MKKENTESENLRHNVNVDSGLKALDVPRLVGLSVGVLAYIGAITVSTWIPDVPITFLILYATMIVGAAVVSFWLGQGITLLIKSIADLKNSFLAHK